MPRALGTFLKLRANEKLTRHHNCLQLPDQLMDVVERDPVAPQAERIAELAHSFAHDVLTLAVLASRCLWYEALTRETRSGDLPAVSADLESYFLFLKAACDVLAELAVELAFEPRRRGQAPSGSFHDLTWLGRKSQEHTRIPQVQDRSIRGAERPADRCAWRGARGYSTRRAPRASAKSRRPRKSADHPRELHRVSWT
jgi:hypothetical protein